MRASFFVVLWIACVVGAPARAAESLELSEGWTYRLGASPVGSNGVPAYALEVDASDWTPMRARASLALQDNLSEMWIRLPLPHGAWDAPAVLVGNFMGVIEAYAGGRRVYAKGSPEIAGNSGGPDSLASLWHLIPLERSDLGGTLAVRLIRVTPATLDRTVRLGERDALVGEIVVRAMPPFVVGMLQFLAALVALVAGLIGGGNRALLAFAAFAGTAGLIIVGGNDLMALFSEHPMRGLYAVLVAFVLNPAALLTFARAVILREPSRWQVFVLRANLVAAAAFGFVVAFVPAGIMPGIAIVGPLTTLVLFSCLVASVIEAWRGNADARLFLGGVLFLFAASLFSTVRSLVFADGSTDASSGGFHWGVLGLSATLAGVMLRRTAATSAALRATVGSLEERRSRLAALSSQLEAAAGTLVAAVEQLRAAGHRQHESLTGQSASIQELAVTVTQIHQLSRVATDRARTTLEASETAQALGKDAAESAEVTRTGLEAIRLEVQRMAASMGAVEEHVALVEGIVSTVKGLADQSNMLAMNAAIEAVRAGEAGRGFGLVAKEVRVLADQSLAATRRIRELLEALRKNTREAVDVSTVGVSRISEGLGQVQLFGERVRSLAGLVRDASGNVRHVTTAIEQQSAGAGELAVAARQLTDAASETSQRQAATDRVTESVGQVAADIRRLAASAAEASAENPVAA